mmetsp:Transcript_49477/g.127490  ORF Transcript_49477/g.127490 Transcript_49477/m.127490 type:complete len:135 (-) Transcript_49477:15-419(-)
MPGCIDAGSPFSLPFLTEIAESELATVHLHTCTPATYNLQFTALPLQPTVYCLLSTTRTAPPPDLASTRLFAKPRGQEEGRKVKVKGGRGNVRMRSGEQKACSLQLRNYSYDRWNSCRQASGFEQRHRTQNTLR